MGADKAYFSKIKFKDNKIADESAVEFMRAIVAFLYVDKEGEPGKAIRYTAGICRKNIGQYCWKECLRRLDDFVHELEMLRAKGRK